MEAKYNVGQVGNLVKSNLTLMVSLYNGPVLQSMEKELVNSLVASW